MARPKKEVEQEVQEQKDESLSIPSHVIGVEAISVSPAKEQTQKTRIVKANYPKDFAGAKYLQDGVEYEMSIESADHLVKSGIAKYVD